jgi:TPR repeat protein
MVSVQEHFNAEPDLARLRDARLRLDREPERALQELKWLASRGSVMSLIYIGETYARGRRVKVDLEEAMRWYKQAAEKGSALAQHLLGRTYFKQKQMEEALACFHQAAAQDYAPSIYFLGRMNCWGLGVPRNIEEGTRLFERAMHLGNLPAKGALAKVLLVYHDGLFDRLRGVWLRMSVSAQFVFVWLTEGLRSEKLRM